MSVANRLKKLEENAEKTGIDFIYVPRDDQTQINVHFLFGPPADFKNRLQKENVEIYDPLKSTSLLPIPVVHLGWDGNILQLTTKEPGDFTIYHLRINDEAIDPYFNDESFSFKAGCESKVDCKKTKDICPPEEMVDFPVDYRVRDFWSFRRALFDFTSQRHPDWQERLEADLGTMLVEVMSALGDEFAYYQDRIAREAYLETATQRRSIRRHAQLIDYQIHDGLAATGWLDINVKEGEGKKNIDAGSKVWSITDTGEKIVFEVGKRLYEIKNNITYPVSSNCNEFIPHIWDNEKKAKCLSIGSTELWIEGHHDELKFDDPHDNPDGKWILLQTQHSNPSIPVRSLMVRVIEIKVEDDPIFDKKITRLVWEKEQSLPFELDLETLKIRGNLVPIIAGETKSKIFIIGLEPNDLSLGLPESEIRNINRAIERTGPNNSTTYLFSLPETEDRQLTFLGATPRKSNPDIVLEEVTFDGVKWVKNAESREWKCKYSFVGSPSSHSYDPDYILEDGTWKKVVTYQRQGKEIVHTDYASASGKTIRFGDDTFGQSPAKGTIFKVTYRLCKGRLDNIPAQSIKAFESSLSFIEEVDNPISAAKGSDPETLLDIKQLAPYAFQEETYRAVIEKDYAEAAECLPWVQRGGASFRWTGSWLSAFVTPDPYNAVYVSDGQYKDLCRQLDRFRQAGREAYTLEPIYANLDLKICICVSQDAYTGDVEKSVLEVLLGKDGVRPEKGFFSADNFTFGTSLNRLKLEATIQAVSGVHFVECIQFRRRGSFDMQKFADVTYKVSMNEIIRVENDSLHPDRGSIQLVLKGGA